MFEQLKIVRHVYVCVEKYAVLLHPVVTPHNSNKNSSDL